MAWEAARKLNEIPYNEEYRNMGFEANVDDWYYDYILANYTASEAIQKIREYEEKQKQDDVVRVGDEVERKKVPGKLVVQSIDNIYANCMDCDGGQWTLKFEDIRKTGKHYPEIESILQQMKGE